MKNAALPWRGNGHLACACRVLGMCLGAEAGAYAELDGPCESLEAVTCLQHGQHPHDKHFKACNQVDFKGRHDCNVMQRGLSVAGPSAGDSLDSLQSIALESPAVNNAQRPSPAG